MDHIPLVENPLFPSLEVPYVVRAEHEYDNLEFSSFPHRKGFDPETLIIGDVKDKSWDETASFLQAWCYFGLLNEILKPQEFSLGIRHFVRKSESGHLFITTNLLPDLLELRTGDAKFGQADKVNDDRIVDPGKTLRDVSKFITRLNDLDIEKHTSNFVSLEPRRKNAKGDSSTSVYQLILLSIAILGDTLTSCFLDVYHLDCISWPKPILLQNRLLEANWCPSEIVKIERTASCALSCLYYLSFLDRRHISKSHRLCTRDHCEIEQLKRTYSTSHWKDDCHCSETFLLGNSEFSVLGGLYPEGDTPIINVLPDTEPGKLQLLVRSSKKFPIPYVAISHVWSDGLGNPRRNSLPDCQLVRLQNMVDELYEPSFRPVPFWIDTILVPVEEGMKKLALLEMRRIYEDADKVLVVDSTLEAASSLASPEECLMRVRCSNWVTRLWTLQEGYLAKELVFQFRDRAVSSNSLMVRYLDTRNHVRREKILDFDKNPLAQFQNTIPNIQEDGYAIIKPTEPIIAEAGRFLCSLRGQHLPTSQTSLARWIGALHGRSTSNTNDEAVCLATLAGLDSKRIINTSPKHRMKKLLISISELPAAILFGDLPRAKEACCRWMPMSFLSAARLWQDGRKEAYPHPAGLIVALPGILIFPEGDIAPSAKCIPMAFEGEIVCMLKLGIHGGKFCWDSQRDDGLAIILKRAPTLGWEGLSGALVSVERREEDVLFTRYEKAVTLDRVSSIKDALNINCIRIVSIPIIPKWYVG
jgi:hypothetical protein